MNADVIVLETDYEDYSVSIKQSGRRVIITTPRKGIAAAMARKIAEAMQPEQTEVKIGF
jgi:hypothetical protein